MVTRQDWLNDYIGNQQRQNGAMEMLNAQQMHEILSRQGQTRDRAAEQEREAQRQILMKQLEAAIAEEAARSGYGRQLGLQNNQGAWQSNRDAAMHGNDLQRLGVQHGYNRELNNDRFAQDLEELGVQHGYNKEIGGIQHGYNTEMERLRDQLLAGQDERKHGYAMDESGQDFRQNVLRDSMQNRNIMSRDALLDRFSAGRDERLHRQTLGRDAQLHEQDLGRDQQRYGYDVELEELRDRLLGGRNDQTHQQRLNELGQENQFNLGRDQNQHNLDVQQQRLQGLRQQGAAVDQLAGQVGAYLPRMQDHLQGQAKAILSRVQSLQEAFDSGQLREDQFLQLKTGQAQKLMQFANPQNFKPMGSMPSDYVMDPSGKRREGIRTNDGKVDTSMRDPDIRPIQHPITGEPMLIQVAPDGEVKPLFEGASRGGKGPTVDPAELMTKAITNAQMRRSSEDTSPISDQEIETEYNRLVRGYQMMQGGQQHPSMQAATQHPGQQGPPQQQMPQQGPSPQSMDAGGQQRRFGMPQQGPQQQPDTGLRPAGLTPQQISNAEQAGISPDQVEWAIDILRKLRQQYGSPENIPPEARRYYEGAMQISNAIGQRP